MTRSNRNDSILNTGISSASSNAVAKKRVEALEKRKEAKVKISPAYDVVKPILDAELKKARDVETVHLDVNSSEATYKAVDLARRMNIAFIKSVGTQIKTALKEVS